ncbi:MAG: DUF2283 domain-containing protein [Chloroflexota bacterium]
MKLKIDKQRDALYLHLDEAEIVNSEEVQPGVIVDFNKDNRVAKDKLNLVQLETV